MMEHAGRGTQAARRGGEIDLVANQLESIVTERAKRYQKKGNDRGGNISRGLNWGPGSVEKSLDVKNIPER